MGVRGALIAIFAVRMLTAGAFAHGTETPDCSKLIPSVSSIRENRIIQFARSHYSSRLKYHNFDHVLDVLTAAQKLYVRVLKIGLKPNWEIIFYSILFHDAGYADDHRALGFKTKEAYAESIARKVLTDEGFPLDRIERIASCIQATDRNGKFEGLEEKIVRAADLSGLADSYEDFYKKSEDLFYEYQFLHRTRPGQIEWKEMVLANLLVYLRQHIQLTGAYYSSTGDSDWHSRVDANIRRFLREPIY